MFGLGPTELIIIAVIVLLIFGARRLPEIGKGIGGAIREFRNVKKEFGPEQAADKDHDNEKAPEKKGGPSTLEDKVMGKVIEQVPGAKKAAEIKMKAEKIKDIIQ